MNKILLFRALVFTLALGYWVYQFFHTEYDNFGIQFRFLTIWALCANVLVAGQMLRLSLGWSDARWDAFVSLAVIMNMSVVFNYWRIYLADPANFYEEGEIIKWYQEYYLHVLGPILLWIDAFLIHRVFRRIKGVMIAVLILGLVYPAWMEFVIQPLNDKPAGEVTNGLPYDFLNDMEIGGRMGFYGAITAINVVFLFVGWGIQSWINRRVPDVYNRA